MKNKILLLATLIVAVIILFPSSQSALAATFVQPVITRTPFAQAIGPWQLVNSMNAIRIYHTSVAVGNYIYVMGGSDGTGPVATVERAAVNVDGSLGAWQVMPPMTIARMHPAAVVYGNYVYVTGGVQINYGPPVDSVERAKINSDGSLGSWEIISHMNSPRQHHGAVATGGYLYVIGGYTGSSPAVNSVQRAPINSDGSLGTWQATSNMTTTRATHYAVTDNRYIYVMGGVDANFTYLNSVERALVNPDGSLGTWELTSSMVSNYT